MPESIYEYKQSDNGYLIDIRIIKIKKDENFPEGIKYSLVAIEKKTGKRILGMNEGKATMSTDSGENCLMHLKMNGHS